MLPAKFSLGSKVLIVDGFYKNRKGVVVKIPSQSDIDNMMQVFRDSGYDSDEQYPIPDAYHVVVEGRSIHESFSCISTDYSHRVTFLQEEDLVKLNTI